MQVVCRFTPPPPNTHTLTHSLTHTCTHTHNTHTHTHAHTQSHTHVYVHTLAHTHTDRKRERGKRKRTREREKKKSESSSDTVTRIAMKAKFYSQKISAASSFKELYSIRISLLRQNQLIHWLSHHWYLISQDCSLALFMTKSSKLGLPVCPSSLPRTNPSDSVQLCTIQPVSESPVKNFILKSSKKKLPTWLIQKGAKLGLCKSSNSSLYFPLIKL